MKTSRFWIWFLFAICLTACQTMVEITPTAIPIENPVIPPNIIKVDDFGANPFDDEPDSTAIQKALDSSKSGDTIMFTSGRNSSGYQGYLVDKTLFLTGKSPKHDLIFTSSDPDNHSLLQATPGLKGFVVRLYARSRFDPHESLYNIDFGYIDVHGGRDERVCMGLDNSGNGEGDNWGSWLPECEQPDDPWCSPGNLTFDGGYSGIVVHDLVSEQGECGTGLGFDVKRGTDNTIDNVIIDTVGDHVIEGGCTNTDDDGDFGGWSDGITVEGSGVTVTNNTVINASDIGIVSFGGKNTIIANNTVKITEGNYGAFAGIAVHSNGLANSSGDQVIGNIIISEGDNKCGGLHTGINIGMHMWGGACESNPLPGTYGTPSCSSEPDSELVGPCKESSICQLYLLLREGDIFTFKDNTVTGAHINYLIEGFQINGQFVDENNISKSPQLSDWEAARKGCEGITWGPLDKSAHHVSLPGYTDLRIHCER